MAQKPIDPKKAERFATLNRPASRQTAGGLGSRRLGSVVEEAGVWAGVRWLMRGRSVRLARLSRRLGSLALAPVYALYTRRLRTQVRAARQPDHVAVILDGNRRWASGRSSRARVRAPSGR